MTERPPKKKKKKNIPLAALAALAASEAKPVREVAMDASARLTRRGVPHALVGGLAVQAHGFERYTRDVDILVPSGFPASNYERRGVAVKFLRSASPRTAFLDGEVRLPDSTSEVPVARVEAVIAMKLLSGRAQDDADIVRLVLAGAPTRDVTTYLRAHVHRLVARFERLVRRAELER